MSAARTLDPLLVSRANARLRMLRGGGPRKPNNPFDVPLAQFMSTELFDSGGPLRLSPLMAGIADASEGRSPHLSDDECQKHFGCDRDSLPPEPRRVVVCRAGGRAGKTSRLLAGKSIHAAFTVPLPTLARGEHAWSLIVAPDKTLAAQALSFVRGYFEANPRLLACVVNKYRARKGETERVGTTEVITVRRPHDGKLVDIRVGVASAGGKWARGKTLVFCGFDEACFFQAEDDKVANDNALFQAAIQRIVPGAQLFMFSTPFIAGYGRMEGEIARDWGIHAEALICQAPTRDLNPTWDPDRTIERHMRATDPDNAAREIDAIPYPAGSKIFFSPEVLAKAVNRNRERTKAPMQNFEHWAAGDLGFVRNSSAMGIARRATPDEAKEGRRVVLAYLEEVKPERGSPLKPSEVCSGFARKCAEYQAWSFLGDIHALATALEEFPKTKGRDWQGRERAVQYVGIATTTEWTETQFTLVRRMMSEGWLELPDDPRLIMQLSRVTSKPVPGGGTKILMPTIGASHGDLAMACVLTSARVEMTEPRNLANRPRPQVAPRDRAVGGGF